MYCPEHLAYKGLGDRVYIWLYWRDVPRERIPLRVWLNPLRYEISIRLPNYRFFRWNREGQLARRAPIWLMRILEGKTK